MDLSGLKTEEEVKSYIPTQLIKYHPKPDMLVFDYVLSGKGHNKKGLISYTLKDLVESKSSSELIHPILLFKSFLKKDGNYLIAYSGNILTVEISNGLIASSKQLKFSENEIRNIMTDNLIVISDKEHCEILKGYFDKVLSLEDQYKKCKKDLFIHKKKSKLKPILLATLPLIAILIVTISITSKYQKTMNELAILEGQYADIKAKNSQSSNNETKYNELLKELYIIKSQETVDLYTVFYELSNFGNSYKILDFNYSNRFIRINALSKNSIELIKNLNTSDMFNFVQNSTITTDNMEQVNFSGDVICH